MKTKTFGANNLRKYGFFSISIALMVAVFFACAKEELTSTESTFLSVEQKNSSFIVKHTGTWCGPCGGWGFTQFQDYIDAYQSTEVMAASVSGSLGGANNEAIFEAFQEKFDFPGTPTFHMNFGQDVSASAIAAHTENPVVANANYLLSFASDRMTIKTTTEFFQNVTGQDYYLTPYVIVDGIVAEQAGNPAGANTVHKKSMVDVAHPVGEFETLYFGRKIASGAIRSGYKVNLDFEVAIDPTWPKENISIGLVISTRDENGKPVFVNAFTKH